MRSGLQTYQCYIYFLVDHSTPFLYVQLPPVPVDLEPNRQHPSSTGKAPYLREDHMYVHFMVVDCENCYFRVPVARRKGGKRRGKPWNVAANVLRADRLGYV